MSAFIRITDDFFCRKSDIRRVLYASDVDNSYGIRVEYMNGEFTCLKRADIPECECIRKHFEYLRDTLERE